MGGKSFAEGVGGGAVIAAIELSGAQAALERHRQPDMLEHGVAPRKVPAFVEWHTISASEFQRIISIFGDYRTDPEMDRCRQFLSTMFDNVSDLHAQHGEFESSPHAHVKTTKSNGANKHCVTRDDHACRPQARPASGSSCTTAPMAQKPTLQIDGSTFTAFNQKLRPLAPG